MIHVKKLKIDQEKAKLWGIRKSFHFICTALYTEYVYTKFQASTTSGNLSVLTQKCNFSTKITEKGHFSHLTRSKGLLELSNLAQKTSSSSSLIAQNFMGTAKEKLARKCCKMLQNTAKTWSFQHFWTLIVEKIQHWRNFGIDTLEYTDYVYTKFQASTTSRNLCVLTQKCNFCTKIAEKGHFSRLKRS